MCPDANALAHLLDGTMQNGDRRAIERHLDACVGCSAAIAELAHQIAPNDPLVGSHAGPYRIVRELGAGGMGSVYVAVHRDVASHVAIKVIHPEHAAKPHLVQRFLVEARAVNRIQSSGVVKVIDLVRVEDGRPAIVMELVEGPTLRALSRSSPMPVETVVAIFTDVLATLAAAHAVGIVHRDLKPDNIVLSASGARVLDFGIAKVSRMPAGQTAPHTRTGALLGTPEYMSPEQVLGAPADARSDLYTVGVVLFEALTGVRPFRGATDFEVMRAQLEAPVPEIRALRPDVPAAIAGVIERALAKRPDDRFASATEMALALAGEPAAPPPAARVWPVPLVGMSAFAGAITLALVLGGASAAVAPPSVASAPETPTLTITGTAHVEPPPRRETRVQAAPLRPAAAVAPERYAGQPVFALLPGKLDPVSALPTARALAEQLGRDAQLTGMIFTQVTSDGAMAGNGVAALPKLDERVFLYTFDLHERDACAVSVLVDPDRGLMTAQRVAAPACVAHPAIAPRCTARELWAKATARGFSPALPANIAWVGREVNFIALRDGVPVVARIADDCR